MANEQKLFNSPLATRENQGESLLAGFSLSLLNAAKYWQSQDQWWDHQKMMAIDSPRGSNADCFQFTQNMWRSTRQVCFGKVTGPDNLVYITGRYEPRGNIGNQFEENLFPPVEYPYRRK